MPSYVEELWSPSSVHFLTIRMLKLTHNRSVLLQAFAQRSFSLRRGLDSIYVFLKLGIILLGDCLDLTPKRRRRPGWVALAQAAMRLVA